MEAESEMKKVYRIKYTLNILPSINDHENSSSSLMRACGSTDELEIFKSKALGDLLEFKWCAYAGTIHKVGLFSHCCYVAAFSAFVNVFYVYSAELHTDSLNLSLVTLGVCLTYPCFYDLTQLKKQGCRNYFSDKWNWCDQLHIWGGLINIYLHWTSNNANY